MRAKVPGISPMTVVEDGAKTTVEELVRRVLKTRADHADLIQQYHEVFYNAPHTWQYTHFLGVGTMKTPNDLWMYQAILTNLRPTSVIETGTYAGGSALWYAYLMDMLGIKQGKVFTVDFEDHRKALHVQHPRITFLAGDSVNPNLVAAIKDDMPAGPVLVSLDSDHAEAHVRQELELYAPLVPVGSWLVCEDTNIGWADAAHEITFDGRNAACSCGAVFLLSDELHNKVPSGRIRDGMQTFRCPNDKSDRGARGGLQDYLEAHPGEWRQDIMAERYLLTMHPGGWLQRMAPYQEAA